MRLLILSFMVGLLATPAGATEPDRAEELTHRTYCVHTVTDGLLATGTSYGLVLFHLNDRGFPTRAGALKLEDAVTALASTGGLVFAGNGPRGLVVVDVTNPDAPKEVVRLETPGAVLRLLRWGDTLFAAMGTMGIGVIDVQNPRTPSLVRRIDVPGTTRDLSPGPNDGLMVAAETLAWIMDPDGDFPIPKYTGVPGPTAVLPQRKTLVGVNRTVTKVDEFGFVTGGGESFRFEDEVRDLEQIPGGVAVAASSDGLVLLAFDGLRNRQVAHLDPGGACTRVHARGDLLFATADAYGFAVYNVKDPANPVKIHPAE